MKNSKKKRNKIAVISVIAAVLIIAAVVLIIVLSGKRAEPDEPVKFSEISLGNGMTVSEFFEYTGPYFEDGSDTSVEKVAGVLFENNGDENIQLLDFSLVSDSGKTYEFEVTTIFPGEKVLVLEKNRASFDAIAEFVDYSIDRYAVFPEKPSLHTEAIMLVGGDNLITVRNMTDKAISSGRVFYKTFDGEKYIGGITYMSSFEEIGAGQEIRINTPHFTSEKSKVVFVTYAE